jgi:N-acetyl-anhydromuramyl-L-alanine amidase AmpD
MASSSEYPDLPFRAPRSYTRGRSPGNPRVIVIHYTASPEGPDMAERGAAYDQERSDGTSTHYHVDSNSVVQCVYTWDRAHAARRAGNEVGIQYELAGTEQTAAQWADPVSRATLTQAAKQAARDATKYKIPIRKLTPAQVRAGEHGFCGHADITLAFPEDHGDHMDPGRDFPWADFLARVALFAHPTPTPDDRKDEPMPVLIKHPSHATVFAVFPSGAVRALGPGEFYAWTAAGAKLTAEVDDAEYTRLVDETSAA